MNHTPQIKRAIQFAARKHHGQFRKETEQLPYITHLFSAALLAAEGGADDDVVTATLLHDTLEDTETTRDEIVRAFNKRVADIVATVTEPKEEAGRALEWKEAKKRYLAQLELGSDDALVVAVADKIDNIESKLEAIAQEGSGVMDRWKQPAESYLWYHGAVLHMAEKRLRHHPLTKRLAEAHKREKGTFTRF